MPHFTEHTTEVENLPTEVFLPHMGNGYVVEGEVSDTVSLSAESYGYHTALSGTFAVITFHTATGDEAYMVLPTGTPVTYATREG